MLHWVLLPVVAVLMQVQEGPLPQTILALSFTPRKRAGQVGLLWGPAEERPLEVRQEQEHLPGAAPGQLHRAVRPVAPARHHLRPPLSARQEQIYRVELVKVAVVLLRQT